MNRPYHHGNLRAALLEIARARLGEGSEAELSLRDLATRAGVTVNATYRHFASKEALLTELAAIGFDALRDRMHEAIAVADDTARGRLRAAGEGYVAFARHDPALFRLMFSREDRFAAHPRFHDAAQGAFQVVVECVAAVRGEDAAAPAVRKAAIAAWSLVHGYATLDLGGYVRALPESCRPSAREVVSRLDVEV